VFWQCTHVNEHHAANVHYEAPELVIVSLWTLAWYNSSGSAHEVGEPASVQAQLEEHQQYLPRAHHGTSKSQHRHELEVSLLNRSAFSTAHGSVLEKRLTRNTCFFPSIAMSLRSAVSCQRIRRYEVKTGSITHLQSRDIDRGLSHRRRIPSCALDRAAWLWYGCREPSFNVLSVHESGEKA
jgi:hypothetical protein